jgi:hypothetical protein
VPGNVAFRFSRIPEDGEADLASAASAITSNLSEALPEFKTRMFMFGTPQITPIIHFPLRNSTAKGTVIFGENRFN